MKNYILLIALAFSFVSANSQEIKERKNKGRMYASYGLNRSSYDLSNLKMKGEGYDVTLTHFDANNGLSEINPSKSNAKLGYYLTEHLSVSLGYDNLTYKSQNNKLVKIGGTIDWGDYAGDYNSNEDVIRMSDEFLSYQYTKLEYFNVNVEMNDDFWVSKNGKLAWSYYGGIGGGVILTQSNVSIFGLESSTKDNGLTGFGGNASFGTRFHVGPVFLDLGGKGGYIKTKDIVSDEFGGFAEHNFLFATGIASIGLSFNLSK